jgi:hypothetical protein
MFVEYTSRFGGSNLKHYQPNKHTIAIMTSQFLFQKQERVCDCCLKAKWVTLRQYQGENNENVMMSALYSYNKVGMIFLVLIHGLYAGRQVAPSGRTTIILEPNSCSSYFLMTNTLP